MTTAFAPLVDTLTIGKLRVHTIQAGGQKLDGCAMFGVVPKPLWERRIPPDERNRIQLGMRCLVIEHESTVVVVDTGAGNKETAKFHGIYGLENAGANGRTLLEDGLASLGVSPQDVGIVIDTHLHFDHAGGNTFVEGGAEPRLTFPNARYVVQRGEYVYATHTNERTAGSYFPHNFAPIAARDRFDFVDGEREIVYGIRVIPTPGHTPFHQSVLIESGGECVLLADLVPTSFRHWRGSWATTSAVVTLERSDDSFARLGRDSSMTQRCRPGGSLTTRVSPGHLNPIPDSRFPIPDSRFRFPIPDSIPDSRFPIPDSRFPFPIPDSRFPIPIPTALTPGAPV
jgi:glyoxylase-like metal-dependent hydrolase (beta-lactamase superfamily II)